MEKISITNLRNLTNMLSEETNNSVRTKLSVWIQEKITNNNHVDLSTLISISQSSSIKEKILLWIEEVTKNTYKFIPDIPA